MKARVPQTVIKPDYRQFRLRKLNTPEFSHIKLLLFWPVFGLAFLALFALRDGPRLRKRAWWQAASVLLALCISLSTVFMKQHSILDVLCALPVCALGWWLCYGRPGRHG